MFHKTFMAHLDYLNTAPPESIAQLYQHLGTRMPWPRLEDGTLLNPLSLITYGTAVLSHQLAPNEDPLSIPEVAASAQAIGMLLNQFSALAIIANVGLVPTSVEGTIAQAIAAGKSSVALDVAEVLGYTEIPDGEETPSTEEAEPPG